MKSHTTPRLKPSLFLLLIVVLWTSANANKIDTRELTNQHDQSYSVEKVTGGMDTEYWFKLDNRHFGTLIDEGGKGNTLPFRPHPGCDINGWGSTWYAQPFLPGATLKHTTIGSTNADSNGIHISASGMVSRDTSATYGTWSLVIDFLYDPVGHVITGTGQYTIALTGPLTDTTGDLNLYKLASNYLDDVPLSSGGTGDTGDMKEAVVRKDPDSIWFTWISPNQPSHFPTDKTDFLSIDVIGQFNNVDTSPTPIAPAFKPSLKVYLTSQRTDAGIMFGGVYNVDDSDCFYCDNVGITPLISKTSSDTEFRFDVVLESVALETYTYLPLIMKR